MALAESADGPVGPHSRYPVFPSSARDAVGDVFAGLIVAVTNIAIAMSFAAFLFKDGLQQGTPTGLWSILITVTVVGLIVGALTGLPPLTGSPDTAVVAAMGFLTPTIAQPLMNRGVSVEVAVTNVLFGFTIVAVASGVVFLAIGLLRRGQALRFVPFPLVGGFLASTGILLMMSATTIVAGRTGSIAGFLAAGVRLRVLAMVIVAVALWGLPKLLRSALTGPLTFVALAVGLNVAIGHALLGDKASWYLPGLGTLMPWSPFSKTTLDALDWQVLGAATPAMLTCVAVGLMSLIVKVSSMETRRAEIADLDHEMRVNGLASLVCGPAGGVAGMLGAGSSELLVDSGARTRLAAVIATVAVGAVIVLHLDLAGTVATPLLGGLLLRSGFAITFDAFTRIVRQQSAVEITLALAITAISLRFGYDVGILAGFVGASLMFAFTYGRIGVVRRHATRASLVGGVERPPEIEALLRAHGDAIHLYSLSGYLFFGSAEALFDQIRSTVEAQAPSPVRFVIIDFLGVTGIDSSAIGTLSKLNVLSGRRGIAVAFTHVLGRLTGKLVGNGTQARIFANNIDALSWCEVLLLAEVAPALTNEAGADRPQIAMSMWLSQALGCEVEADVIARYFQRQTIAAGANVYRQGEIADTIDFICSGSLAVHVTHANGTGRTIRLLTQRTVVGEMGFFRGTCRSASISAQTDSVIYTLGTSNVERLQRDQPAVYEAMLAFFICTLADRVERAHGEISALQS